MEILETLHDKPPILSNFIPRKYKITHDKTFLLGAKKSGITSIILDFLSNLDKKSYLYIDLHDIRIKNYNFSKLHEFVKKSSIKYLIVENFTHEFDLPNVKNIILSSHDQTLSIHGFFKMGIYGLDFEEFIAFTQRNYNVEHIFKLYANLGVLPKSIYLNEYENKIYLQEVLKLSLSDEIAQNLFYILAKNQANAYSLFSAYNELKPLMKLSKDKLYKMALKLENLGFVSLVEKFNSPKSPKKIYLNNFAYKNAITHEKDFNKRFENMVFCELKNQQIYYTDKLHFYLPKKHQAILVIPFLPPELIKRRFKKILSSLKDLQITSLKVITLGNEGHDKQDGILCEIVPFWEWALLL